MRRFLSIAAFTAREILSGPLSLLLTDAAAVVAFLAAVMHCHQFGDASRMAREASFSAIVTGGALYAIFCTIKTVRSEFESGTADMALSHSVSRTSFFLAKTCGALAALAVFWATLSSLSVTIVNGSIIGAEAAAKKGDVPSMWGPSAVVALSAILVPILVAAALNRFRSVRFALAAMRLTFILSVLSVAYRFDGALVARYFGAYLLLAMPPVVFAAAAAAFAVRWRDNIAALASGVLFALSVPALGNYCLSDALSRGGTVPWTYVALAAAAALFPLALALAAGAYFMHLRDGEGA